MPRSASRIVSNAVVIAVAGAAAILITLVVVAKVGAVDRGAANSGSTNALVARADFSPRPLQAGKAVRWRVRLANRSSAPRTLTFRTSQRAEVVLRRAGVVRYRWSQDRLFAPVIQRRTLQGEKSWTFALADTLKVRPGRYELLATITARPTPRTARASVVVVAG